MWEEISESKPGRETSDQKQVRPIVVLQLQLREEDQGDIELVYGQNYHRDDHRVQYLD